MQCYRNMLFGAAALATIHVFAAYAIAQKSPPAGSDGPAPFANFPSDVYPDSRLRLPLVKRDEMDEYGKKIYDLLAGVHASTIPSLEGTPAVWLHSPRLGEHWVATNHYLRKETDLGGALTELAILVTARELSNQYEWSKHEPAAVREGLAAATINTVKYRKDVAGLPEKEALIIQFGRELFGQKKVSSDTFARAVQLFGRKGVVELTALMGHYSLIAALINAFDIQLRPDEKPLLPAQ